MHERQKAWRAAVSLREKSAMNEVCRSMIVKKIKYTKNTKPKEWQIGDLVEYIRNPTVKNRGEKVEHAGSRNFLTGTHTAQKLEMIALARETVRSKMPVNHWVFSWKKWA